MNKLPQIKIFSQMEFAQKEFKAGDIVDLQVMRTGKWNHPIYGKFKITEKELIKAKDNFDKNILGRELYVDENHEPDHKALAWFRELYFSDKDNLMGKMELTKRGAEVLTEGLYKYFSPEIYFEYEDTETGNSIEYLLVGGAFTNNPFFRGMQPLMASEVADQQTEKDEVPKFSLFFNATEQMNTFLQKVAEFAEKGELKANMDELKKEFSALEEGDEKAQIKNNLVNSFGFTFSEEEEAPEDDTKEEETNEEEEKEDESEEKEEEETDESEEEDEEEEDEEEDEEEADKTETLKASEVAILRERAKKADELERAAKFSEMQSIVKPFLFSEGNEDARIPAKFSDKLTKIALSLSEKKRSWLFSILKEVRSFSELTKELGSDQKGETLTKENAMKKFNEAVEAKVKEGVSRYDAMSQVYNETPQYQELLG